jgi:hypothetical protein
MNPIQYHYGQFIHMQHYQTYRKLRQYRQVHSTVIDQHIHLQ